MIEKLIAKIEEKKAPIVVGLDPALSMVPPHILDEAVSRHGESLEAAGEALFEFNKSIVDATCDLIPAVKPQSAMYERYGLPGLMAYKKTIDYCHEKGLIVIADIKRGDIGSTSQAYADGHLGTVHIGSKEFAPFDADFATVNPYLGSDGVKPFVEVAKAHDKGLFVLTKTSNPSSGEFQDRMLAEDDKLAGMPVSGASVYAGRLSNEAEDVRKPLYEYVAQMVNIWGQESLHGDYSDIGAVVGATYPEVGLRLRKVMKKAYILVPGYGAQGGKGKDLKAFFNSDGLGAIVNSSRGIIAAWQNEKYRDTYGEKDFAEASRRAVLDMKADIASSVGL